MSVGLVLRTHPDDGDASFRVMLERAESITMDDGASVRDWPRIIADSSTVGVNGRDTGSLVGDVWYEVHAIRNSSDDSRGLVLHRRKNYVLDQAQQQGVNVLSLRDNAVRLELGQTFSPALCGPMEVLDIAIRRFGSPQGNIWMQVETEGGTVLAVSDKIQITKLASATVAFNLRFIFRDPAVLSSSNRYKMTLNGDYPVSTSNCVQWFTDSVSSYSGGEPSSFDGTTWATLTNDFTFKAYITQNDSPVSMPSGYDQRALIAFLYTNRNAPYKFDPMVVHDRHHAWAIRSTGKYPGTNGRMDLEDFTNTMAVVKDSNIVFPHGLTVTADIEVSKNAPGIVIVGNATTGYRCTANDFDNAATGKINAAGDSVYAGRITTEAGALYALTDSGQATVFVPSWSW